MQLFAKDAARMFRVSEKTIYRWIAEAGLPAMRINKQYRFNQVELLEWAAAHQVNVPPELSELEAAKGSLPALSEALEAGGVHHGVGGTDMPSVLERVVTLLPLPDSADRDFLLHVLLEREALGSTAVGDGIAIPHVRNPIVLRVSEPSVTLCFLEQAINFHALDGKPVSVLFTLISPTIRQHLHVLSRLSFALHDDRFKRVVLRNGSREEILREAQRIEEGLGSGNETPTGG